MGKTVENILVLAVIIMFLVCAIRYCINAENKSVPILLRSKSILNQTIRPNHPPILMRQTATDGGNNCDVIYV